MVKKICNVNDQLYETKTYRTIFIYCLPINNIIKVLSRYFNSYKNWTNELLLMIFFPFPFIDYFYREQQQNMVFISSPLPATWSVTNSLKHSFTLHPCSRLLPFGREKWMFNEKHKNRFYIKETLEPTILFWIDPPYRYFSIRKADSAVPRKKDILVKRWQRIDWVTIDAGILKKRNTAIFRRIEIINFEKVHCYIL